MVLKHILLTKFSIRQRHVKDADGSLCSPYHTPANHLKPHSLEQRFRLFEMLCLPGVLAQTQPDFLWVLIIDPQLKERDRSRLEQLTGLHRSTVLVEYHENVDINGLMWLEPYVGNAATTHVVTTNIDNDDVVGIHLVEYLQKYLRETCERGALPPCSLVGWPSTVQWDFMPMAQAPWGHLKPWQRGEFPAATGYTVCCKWPDYDVSVYGFAHTGGTTYFDPKVASGNPTQVRLRALADHAGDDWRAWQHERHLHILRSVHPQVVVVNHFENDQVERLFDRWSTRRPISHPTDLPDMPVDFARIRIGIRAFRRSSKTLFHFLSRGVRTLWSSWSSNSRSTWQALRDLIALPVWFIAGLPEKKVRRPSSRRMRHPPC